jgi:FixJ family two-component response regulator
VQDISAVFVVDDDAAVRASLAGLLNASGLAVESFCSADEFLAGFDAERAGCVVLDIRLAGMGALELQQRLCALHAIVPIVFITGHGDVPLAIEAMQHGAVDFLQTPFKDRELLERVGSALAQDRDNRACLKAPEAIRARLECLSQEERDVLEHFAADKPDRQVAGALGLSVRSVEIHRARLLEKMSACSQAHLVRMALEVRRPH